jgi:guanylate kinase
MARLIIVSGASGAGKSFLLNELKNIHNLKAEPLRKMTTRGARNESEAEKNKNGTLDLILNCTQKELQDCDYTYEYCGYHYGFNKKEIDKAIAEGLHPIVIVAKCPTIELIKKDYHNALVLYVQNVLSGNDLKKKLIVERDPVEIKERLRRQDESFDDYVNHIQKKIFDYVLINNYTRHLKEQVNYIFNNELDINDSNYVFVIMPFAPKYNEIYQAFNYAGEFYTKHNKNVTINRVDKQQDSGFSITERIEMLIKRAGLIICDVSEASPNVYYEFGYAKAKNKNIIITAKKETKLPFDTGHYEHMFYESPMDLQEKIITKLKNYFKVG